MEKERIKLLKITPEQRVAITAAMAPDASEDAREALWFMVDMFATCAADANNFELRNAIRRVLREHMG